MFWLSCWIEANHLEMIMVKSDEVGTMLTLSNLYHTVTLVLYLMLIYDLIASAQ